jgi:hypothetical protein
VLPRLPDRGDGFQIAQAGHSALSAHAIAVSRSGLPRRTASRSTAHGRRLAAVFLFFSNRLSCLGSLLVSIVVTVVLVLIFTR